MPLTLLGFALQRFPLSESRTPLGAVAPLRFVTSAAIGLGIPDFHLGLVTSVCLRRSQFDLESLGACPSSVGR